MGIFENEIFSEDRVNFTVGDKLVLYSDGMYETMGRSGDLYGIDRLVNFIQSRKRASGKEIISELLKDIEEFWDGKSAPRRYSSGNC